MKIEKLRDYVKAHTTYKKLAVEVGTSEKYLNHIALGRKYASPEMAKKISLATGGIIKSSDILPDVAKIFQEV